MTDAPEEGQILRVPLGIGSEFTAIVGLESVSVRERDLIGGNEVIDTVPLYDVDAVLLDGRYRDEDNRQIVADIIEGCLVTQPEVEERIRDMFSGGDYMVQVDFSLEA